MNAITTTSAIASTIAPNTIDFFLMELASNKFFNTFIMVLMNVGGKYIVMELPTNLDKLFQSYQILRYLVIFAICFMASRDIKTALFMALVVIVLFKFILNEQSMYCVLRGEHFENLKPTSNIPPTNSTSSLPLKKDDSNKRVSDDDFNKARNTVDEYLKQNNHKFTPKSQFLL